jgi:predicted amidohydrolase
MATRKLHVAAAQIISSGPLADTLGRMERQAASAAAVGADLVLFSECALHGYDFDMTAKSVRAVAETTDGPGCGAVSRMAERLGISMLAGFFEKDGNEVFNSVLVARNDGSRDVQRKHVITPGEITARLSPGPRRRTVFDFHGVRCAVVICSDGGLEGLHEELRAMSVDFRLCPTGGGGDIKDMLRAADLGKPESRALYAEKRSKTFKTEAILDEQECPFTGFASANALGPAGRRTCHQGHCMIVDNRRVMRAQIPGTIILEHMQDQMIHSELAFD